MTIFVLGINHETASLGLRETVHFSPDKLPLLLQDFTSQESVREAVFISTCNRTELYAEAEDLSAVYEWLLAKWPNEKAAIDKALYIYRDEEAIKHMMSVASGLDSMVLGEPQILGQMKEAFSESCSAGSVGAVFYRLFQQIFNVAKEVRTSTMIGACPVSVASAAVHFAKNRATDFIDAKIVLIGAGDTGQLLTRYLSGLKKPISILNRSIEKAQMLAETCFGEADTLENIAEHLIAADIVFSATSSPTPIINKALMQTVMSARSFKPLCLIDIAVPRDIDPTISELSEVTLYCVDDLKSIIEQNRKGRHHAAEKASLMILEKSRELFKELQSLDKVAHTIRAYRGQIEALCRAELCKAKQQLHGGVEAYDVLDMFARNFTQKLMHAPSVQLRQAGVEGRFELLRFAKQLFSLPDPETELS